MSDRKISVYAENRSFTVIPHVLVWDWGKRSTHELLFASYVGVPEAVKAVTACILEGREIRCMNKGFIRNGGDPYRRVEKPIGMGDVAHGSAYSSLFELASIESQEKADEFNRALIFAPDGDLETAVVAHAMSRFGLPDVWKNEYYNLIRSDVYSLRVDVHPDLTEWKDAKAAIFSGTEARVIEAISSALIRGELSIPTGSINGAFNQDWTMTEYLINNAEHLGRQLAEKQPRHTFDAPLDPSIANLKRIPFPIQAHMIQALVNTLDAKDKPEACFCGGDMGSGKSIIAAGVCNVLYERKKRNGSKRGLPVLLSAPGITLSKWEHKEIKGTIAGAKVNIIRSGNDALALLRKIRSGHRPEGIEFTMVGIDRAKLGSETYFSGHWKRLKGSTVDYAWHCPDCGKPIHIPLDKKDKSAEKEMIPADWSTFAEGLPPTLEEIHEARINRQLLANGLPEEFKVKWLREAGILMKCSNVVKVGVEVDDDESVGTACKAHFWRPALKSRGETKNKPRVNISQILKRTKRYFSLYIADEAHQCKAENSGRGDAFAQMVRAAKRTLMLTGTVTNGKSTSIKELLWRTDPKSLLELGFDHTTGSIEWAKRYGKLEQVVYEDEGDNGVITRRKNKGVTTKEGPGIAPHLTAQFLLHKAGFIELPDMGLPLVELKEIPVFIQMDDEHRNEYTHFHNTLYDTCARVCAVSGNSGVWSKFNPATLVYADRSDLEFNVVIGDDVIHAPALHDGSELNAKERWLVDTVKAELAEGRRVSIYNSYTGHYGMNERIRDVLLRNGIRCQILDEPNTDTRADRIAEYEEAGIPVIICNKKLVEVGLDLSAPRSSITT